MIDNKIMLDVNDQWSMNDQRSMMGYGNQNKRFNESTKVEIKQILLFHFVRLQYEHEHKRMNTHEQNEKMKKWKIKNYEPM
jgi:hypothetical protein